MSTLILRNVVLAGTVAVFAAGCTTSGSNRISDLESKLARAERQNDLLRKSVKDGKSGACPVAATGAAACPSPTASASKTTRGAAGRGNADLPPNARPGECYARALAPPVTKSVTEKVLVKEASNKIKLIPAQTALVEQKVLVKESFEEVVEVIPAKYKTITEKVLVKEAVTKLIESPAKYKTVEEKILVKPAYTTWKKGTGPIQRVDHATGEIMCLVEVPAQYKTVKRRVLASAGGTSKKIIPAEYKTVSKKVMTTPPQMKTVKRPAEYKVIKVRKVVKQAKEIKTPVAAEYKTVTKEVVVTDAKLSWSEVLCETNVTPNIVADIQRALKGKGYNPGKIDGVIGSDTSSAVSRFQRDNKLASGGLTLRTLEKLGVNPR